MEREEKVSFILKQFKKRSKKLIKKNLFTEFFLINRERRVLEFLSDTNQNLIFVSFFKEFLPKEFESFVNIKVTNDSDEEVRTWYYNEEDLVLTIEVNWGFKKQEISTNISIDNFLHTILSQSEIVIQEINYDLFNDYLISFLTSQAKKLAKIFNEMSFKKNI